MWDAQLVAYFGAGIVSVADEEDAVGCGYGVLLAYTALRKGVA